VSIFAQAMAYDLNIVDHASRLLPRSEETGSVSWPRIEPISPILVIRLRG
jgi:hypothetical protein